MGSLVSIEVGNFLYCFLVGATWGLCLGGGGGKFPAGYASKATTYIEGGGTGKGLWRRGLAA